MKLVLHSQIIFFGTILAAGLVALGEPTTDTAATPPATAIPLASAR